ncbi:ABC transporter ATP-binding protein [Murdochiella vaginalis]|uniref:ABC transporter ATP-binding protein n=1 Tax=Murdochiella vaginalis TaxID=1852373 RepID=UPI0008FE4CA1|nr:ABC transporter ATP-binding protein [Murdochiella vaginalis]
MKHNLLSVKNISFSYNHFDLKEISFEMNAGEIIGFIGQNGAGKTTTLKCITGQLSTNKGSISLLDYDINLDPVHFKSNIAYVSEDTSIYDMLSLKQFVNIFKYFYKSWDQNMYEKLMHRFLITDHNKKIAQLSKGMKMKFYISFALAHHAKLLILDEPTSGLDPFIRTEFLELLKEKKEEGVSTILSTHITEDILKISDRIIFISNGKLKFDLPAQGIEHSCFLVEEQALSTLNLDNYVTLLSKGAELVIWCKSLDSSNLIRYSDHFKPLSFENMLSMLNN